MNSPIMEMEMQRLDSEIEKTKRQFYSALLRKKRRVKRTWLEISSLTNAHLLQMLPYRAMLGHVAKLAEERDQIIGKNTERLQESSPLSDDDTNDIDNCQTLISKSNGNGADSSSENSSSSYLQDTGATDSGNLQSARDEAVQTEESSFGLQKMDS